MEWRMVEWHREINCEEAEQLFSFLSRCGSTTKYQTPESIYLLLLFLCRLQFWSLVTFILNDFPDNDHLDILAFNVAFVVITITVHDYQKQSFNF